MNTPAHALINLALLSHPKAISGQIKVFSFAILLGALLPDALMFIFYVYEKLMLATPEQIIWQERYFLPAWQNSFDIFNSIPLILIGFTASVWQKSPFFQALTLSMLLHCLFDLPLHNDDAHRHFFPFSDWRFISPVSYWDPDHFGRYMIVLEIVFSLAACAYLTLKQNSAWVKVVSVALLCAYIAFGVYAYCY